MKRLWKLLLKILKKLLLKPVSCITDASCLSKKIGWMSSSRLINYSWCAIRRVSDLKTTSTSLALSGELVGNSTAPYPSRWKKNFGYCGSLLGISTTKRGWWKSMECASLLPLSASSVGGERFIKCASREVIPITPIILWEAFWRGVRAICTTA